MPTANEKPELVRTNANASRARALDLSVWLPVAIQLFTAAGFAFAHFRGGISQHDTFGKLMQMEFIAIHSGLFIGVFVLVRSDSTFLRGMRWVAVALLSVFYLKIGYSIMGWVGVLELATLTVCTYSGLLWATKSAQLRMAAEIGARWFIGFMAFGLIGRLFGMPSEVNTWSEFPTVLLYGACYFATLAAIEATGLYRRIRS